MSTQTNALALVSTQHTQHERVGVFLFSDTRRNERVPSCRIESRPLPWVHPVSFRPVVSCQKSWTEHRCPANLTHPITLPTIHLTSLESSMIEAMGL